jgi:hypothetical protein
LPQIAKTRNSNFDSKKKEVVKKEKAANTYQEPSETDGDILRHCSSSLEVIPNDSEKVETKQQEFYQRLPNGDYCIYDSRAKIMTFKNKSMQSNEIFIYQDLDF